MAKPFNIHSWTFDAAVDSILPDDGESDAEEPFWGVLFLGSECVRDESITEGPFPGWRYTGRNVPMVLCNDLFEWACGDVEEIDAETWLDFVKAVDDCDGGLSDGASLYCCRRRGMRPQGAIYSTIRRDLWPLFDACGPDREIDHGNPSKPGEYRPERMDR